MTSNDSALTVVETQAPVVYNLDDFPEATFNRLIPTETIRIPSDLLVPVVQVVRLSLNEADKDVYSSRDIPTGQKAPTARGLNKLATAAGVSFYDERRTDDGANPDVIGVTVMASMLLPTGQRITAPGSKSVDLSAQSWASPSHRAKYKSFFYEHVSTRARNRAIRALLSLKSSYTEAELRKPFAVVSYAPNMNHPLIQQRMIDNLAPAVAQLYGGAEPAQIGPGAPVQELRQLPPDEDEARDDSAPEADGDGLPDWAAAPATKPAEAAETKAAGKGKPKPKPLVERLAESAEASAMEGPVNEAQRARLVALIGRESDLNWSLEVLPVLLAAFGEDFAPADMTAAQAQAIANVAEALESATPPIAFADAWREAAEDARKAAA